MSGWKTNLMAQASRQYIEGYCNVYNDTFSFRPYINYSLTTITVTTDSNGYWKWVVPQKNSITSFSGCFSRISQAESDKLLSVRFNGDYTYRNISMDSVFGTNSGGTLYSCTNIKKVFGISVKTSSFNRCFQGCTALEEIGFDRIIQYGSTIMLGYTFGSCTSLKHIYGLDKTTFTDANISYAFQHCDSIEEIELGNWEITSMSRAFQYCYKVKYIKRNNSTINIASNAYLNLVFSQCYELEDIDNLFSRSNCDIHCSYLNSIFYACYKLKSADLSGITTQANSTFNSMFFQCRNLEDVVMPDFSALNGVHINLTSIFRESFSVKLNAQTCPDLSNIIASRADYVFSTASNSNMVNWQNSTGKTAFINMTHISIPTIPNGTNVSGFCPYARYATDVISCGDISETMTFGNNPLNLASAILIIQHLQDVTSYGGCSITFSSTTLDYIRNDSDAMSLVAQKQAIGWTFNNL